MSRQWAKAESDGGAWALFDVVSGQYDMLSQGKYQLSCQVMDESAGKAFKGNANYKKAKSAKKRFRVLCLLAYIEEQLFTLALRDSTTVRHDRTKSTHASRVAKATLKGKVHG